MSATHSQADRFALIGLASTALSLALILRLRPVIAQVFVLTAVRYDLSMGCNLLAQRLLIFQQERLSSSQMLRYGVMHGGALWSIPGQCQAWSMSWACPLSSRRFW